MSILCALVVLASGQATLTAPVEVPFTIGDDAIIVNSVVNGKPAALMFDTGFSGSVILDSALNIGTPTGIMNLRDFVGQFQASTVQIKSLKLGAMNIDPTGMEAVQQPRMHMSTSYNTNCIGIMGFEVISNYTTEINFEKRKFIFHPKSVDISKRTPDNKKTYLAKLLPKGAKSMEMAVEAPNGKKLVLALDTGNAFYATTHKEVLERVGLWKAGAEPKFVKASFVASGEVASWDIRLKDMNIYGVPVPDAVWNIIDLPSSSAEHDGTVGFGFLKNFNITIDFARRRVWLDNFTGKTGSELIGDIGIFAFPIPEFNNRMTVVRVSKGSPADKAGIKRGDTLLSVDGNDILDTDIRRVMKLMEGPQGSTAKLVLSRSGQLLRMDVIREYLANDALSVSSKP